MTSPSHTGPSKLELLDDLLKRVSRSFYLTLIVVPRRVRDQLGLAYLFARAADTIADTDLIDRQQRLGFLKQFKAQFAGDRVGWNEVRAIQTALVPYQRESAERTLLERLEECFKIYLNFVTEDRNCIRQLMGTLTRGMEMDLTVFEGDATRDLTALRSMDELDRYTYYVAGCVGEFWTHMICAHVPSLARWDAAAMAPIGVRFGKGLQLTNVLKDVARDLQRGRCYLPEPLLRKAGLVPRDLLRKESLPALRPVLVELIRIALEHLDQGWLYTLAIPRRAVRVRLACMWPILFAGHTLRRVAASTDLLDPTVNVKMPKSQVRLLMGLTTLTGACGSLWTAYWGYLRKQVVV
ncbi:MAG: phytoene/squalene synthase family protein [Nitrospiraceae bacterium]